MSSFTLIFVESIDPDKEAPTAHSQGRCKTNSQIRLQPCLAGAQFEEGENGDLEIGVLDGGLVFCEALGGPEQTSGQREAAVYS